MSTTSGADDEVLAADFKLNFLGGCFLVLVLSSILALVLYSMPSTHSEYRELVGGSAPIVLQDRGLSVFYLGWAFCIGIIFWGIYICFIGIRGYRRPSSDRIIFRYFSWYMIVTIVLLVVGYHAGNKYWSDYFSAHGYTRCSWSFFMTGNWGQDVWVDDLRLCDDDEVSYRLSSHRYRLSDINEYVVGTR